MKDYFKTYEHLQALQKDGFFRSCLVEGSTFNEDKANFLKEFGKKFYEYSESKEALSSSFLPLVELFADNLEMLDGNSSSFFALYQKHFETPGEMKKQYDEQRWFEDKPTLERYLSYDGNHANVVEYRAKYLLHVHCLYYHYVNQFESKDRKADGNTIDSVLNDHLSTVVSDVLDMEEGAFVQFDFYPYFSLFKNLQKRISTENIESILKSFIRFMNKVCKRDKICDQIMVVFWQKEFLETIKSDSLRIEPVFEEFISKLLKTDFFIYSSSEEELFIKYIKENYSFYKIDEMLRKS